MAELGQPFRNRRRNVVTKFNSLNQQGRDAFNLLDEYWATVVGNGNVADVGAFFGVDYRALVTMYWPTRVSADVAAMDDLATASGFYQLEGVERDHAKWSLLIQWFAALDG